MAKTNIKQENYTAVADFMLASLERDLADFTKIFKTIDNDFLAQFKKANEDLKNASSSLLIKENQKKITQELYAQADAFRDKLMLLKVYAKRANLETPILQETIAALKSRNIEKVVKNTREMLPFFTQNAAKIKDMPADFLNDIPTIITAFETKNTEQNTLISKCKQTTTEYKPLYDGLYKFISEVAEAGKIIYKDHSKKDDYTISKIISRVEVANPKKTIESAKKE